MRKPHLVHTAAWRAPPRAGQRRKFDFGILAPPLAATAVAVLALFWLRAGMPLPDAAKRSFVPVTRGISVVDGDTIRINGRLTRLTGFNAPETWKPNCTAEQRLGEAATARLRQLVDGGEARYASVRCACRPGTEGTMNCNYGRACGSLRVDGRDVGDILISEGLAVRYRCGTTGCPPSPRPWCG